MSHPIPDTPGPQRPVVPIPASLAHLPTVGGLAVPWITLATPEGRYVFGAIDADRQRFCLYERRCKICGFALTQPFLLLARHIDLTRQLSAEPGLHPWCAGYTTRACPMLSGHLEHYRRSDRDLAHLLQIPSESIHREPASQTQSRRGALVGAWFTVWLNAYRVIQDDLAHSLAASFEHHPVLRVRRVAEQVIS
ncbi:MAG TPA: hypothetical protein VLJ88_11625 [Propionibacteriaceae bacterium]|nr:hypothetical protein [Propionibacteriaceae bacterium]